jgi:WD40 repeat protein
VQVLDAHRGAVRDVLVLPGGQQAASVGDAGEVELWDVDDRTGTWSLGESLVGHAGRVEQVEAPRAGRTLLTASADGQLIGWDLSDDAGFGASYPGLPGRWVSNRIGVVDPGRLVVAPTRVLASAAGGRGGGGRGADDVAATFLDPRSGRVVDQVVVGRPAPDTAFGSSVAVSPDSRQVAITSSQATTVIDTRTRGIVARIPMPLGHGDFVWCSAWTLDGAQLLLGVEGDGFGGLVVIDTVTWEVERVVDVDGGSPQVLEWSRDGSILAAGINFTGKVQLFDRGLRHVRTIDLGLGGDVFDLDFSPDGRLLAAGRVGGQLSVVDTASWRPVHPPVRVSSGSVDDVEWLPDGNTVATAGFDETVSLYDVRRDLVRSEPLPAASDPGEGRTFLMPRVADQLVVVDEGGPGHRYPLEPARWLSEACTIAGRDLTRVEWARYLPDEPYEPVCHAERQGTVAEAGPVNGS